MRLSTFTDSAVHRGRNTTEDYSTDDVKLPFPALVCVDCIEAWVFPGPEKIGDQIEDHLNSIEHKVRVERRLDMAWEAKRRREIKGTED